MGLPVTDHDWRAIAPYSAPAAFGGQGTAAKVTCTSGHLRAAAMAFKRWQKPLVYLAA
jgi:hypothetical protein